MSLKKTFDNANPNDAALGRYDLIRPGMFKGPDDAVPHPVAFLRSHYMDNEGNVKSQIIAADEKFLNRLRRESESELADKNNLNPNSDANLNMVRNVMPSLVAGEKNPMLLGKTITPETLSGVTSIDNLFQKNEASAPKLRVDPLGLNF